MSAELQGRAEGIVKSSQQTNARLREQTANTNQLVEFSQKLLEAVSVFKLPDTTQAPATQLHGGPASADSKEPADASVASFPDSQAVANA